jgi:hypothetical protein
VSFYILYQAGIHFQVLISNRERWSERARRKRTEKPVTCSVRRGNEWKKRGK